MGRAVLCDIVMPGASGPATAAALRPVRPGGPRDLSLGRIAGQVDAYSIARRFEAVATLEKPVRPGAIVEAVRRAVGEG